MKVSAIVSALNEEKTVGNVLKILLQSEILDEVILVDGGSDDRTVEIGRKLGARVLTPGKMPGKGEVMKVGVESTDAEIIAFFDADLLGLRPEHASLIVEPVLKGEVAMCVGLRGRLGGMPKIMAKIDPIGGVIGGERAMKRSVFENIPFKFIKGFAVETSLNYYCRKNKLPVRLVDLEGLDIVIKEKKWGFWKGFLNRIKMTWQLQKIKVLILLHGNEFKNK
ncbi:MAG: glycosyltransferase [Candidatus Nealsonbacteria bacterium]